jgi:hypothetical protein
MVLAFVLCIGGRELIVFTFVFDTVGNWIGSTFIFRFIFGFGFLFLELIVRAFGLEIVGS